MIREKLFLSFTTLILLVISVLSHRNYIHKSDSRFNILFFENRSNFLNDSIVNKMLIQKIENKENQSILKLDLKNIEDYLELFPEVRNAEVFFDANGTVNVKIFESSALLRIQNENFYIDSYGEKIPFSKNFTPVVPIYSGIFRDKNLEDLIILSELILNDSYLKSEFVEIWEDKYGFSIRLRNYDFEVFFGDSKNSVKKIKKLKAFCAFILENKYNKKPKRIDLTVYDQIISTD